MFIFHTKEFEEQRYGRNKNTTIDHTYINSGHYRNKFDAISGNQSLNRILYKLSKEMLEHRSGTLFEDMYWIDLNTFKIVARETDGVEEEQIIYSKKTKKVVKEHDNLLTIHSHPNSFPPSIGDLNSNFINGYTVGIVVCHDGKIYMYNVMEEIGEKYYNMTVAEYLNLGYDENDAQLKALEEITSKFDIQFKEVTGNDV